MDITPAISADRTYKWHLNRGQHRMAESRARNLAQRELRRDLIQAKWGMRCVMRDNRRVSSLTERIKCSIRYEIAMGEWRAAIERAPRVPLLPALLRKDCSMSWNGSHAFTKAHPNSGNQHCVVCDVREENHSALIGGK